MMYLFLDDDDTYAVMNGQTNPTITSLWWSTPLQAVQHYFGTPHLHNGVRYYPAAEVIASFVDVASYDEFCTLYPEYLI